MSLALATLLYEWRRYTAAMVALAFAGLLILAQAGMFTGIVKGVTATLDRSRADIIILPPKMESLINSGGGSLPARLGPQLYLNPEVTEVAPWDIEGGRWVNHPKDGKKAVTTYIDVNMVDTRPGAVTLPTDFTEETRRALSAGRSLLVRWQHQEPAAAALLAMLNEADGGGEIWRHGLLLEGAEELRR